MEDTEWNDILREKGIIPEIKQEELEELVDQVIQEHNFKPLEKRDLDELDELEDEEDDRVLEHYRRMRIQAIKEQLANEKYGTVTQISKTDYPVEVTEASKECWVVVHLFQHSVPDSKFMSAVLERLAAKYKATKFVKIVADMCIPNYPDKNVPTLLIYGNGDLQKQIIGLSMFGGKNAENIEMILKGIGAIKGDKKKDDDEEDFFNDNKQKEEESDDDWD
ncbi:hypothetical protein HDV04_005465 [Boothiomyces sp. JEL0838]|nr:hypothetical protein HDV04_005448 [Boothiomyces sp. JEL0838]KAJ3310042.1 hypothetical protein HDV04_005465 [Boothiomyces sp. JEL0838]